MQLFSVVYIVLLHMILNGFSDEAVAAPGLYCKAQSFFTLLFGCQTCFTCFPALVLTMRG